jgi:ABC-type dipeptide/oligopeptide/nickel transport system permease subunit
LIKGIALVTRAVEREPARTGRAALDAAAGGSYTRRFADFWRLYSRSAGAVVGAAMLIALVAVTIAARWIEPYDPIAVDPKAARQGSSADHWFGTDMYGRDVLSRVIDGAHISLEMGLAAVVISVVCGTVLGLIAGYAERLLDSLIMRFIDMLLAFPGILLALAIVAALGASLRNVILAVGIGTIPVYARVVRGTVLSTKHEPYVEAARVIGCSDTRVVVRHILPNLIAPVLVLATIGVAYSILNGSALSFLGLGVQPPDAEWGLMVAEGKSYLRDAWWMTTAPGLALAVTVLAMNLVGDGLRDAFDPRTRRR